MFYYYSINTTLPYEEVKNCIVALAFENNLEKRDACALYNSKIMKINDYVITSTTLSLISKNGKFYLQNNVGCINDPRASLLYTEVRADIDEVVGLMTNLIPNTHINIAQWN